MYTVQFFHEEIEHFIEQLGSSSHTKCIYSIKLLEKYGLYLRMPHVKKIVRNLYELRITGHEEVRLLFTPRGTYFIILLAFKKKTNKIEKKYLTTALQRMHTI